MKVLVCVLCSTERSGWINPSLCCSLLGLQQDPRFDLTVEMVRDKMPVEHARNLAMVSARARGVDAAVMFDNDNVPPADFADILHDAIVTGKDVVSLPSGVLLETGPQIIPADNGARDGNFRTTGCAGGGVLIVSSEVWRRVPRGPWFRWLTNDDEVLSRKLGEDYFFCELVQQHGMTVWTHEHVAGHLKTTELTHWTLKLKSLERELSRYSGEVRSIEEMYPPAFVETPRNEAT